ncbi:MAG: class I SAM-dependent methyltransferase [Armatimonadota bacterium]
MTADCPACPLCSAQGAEDLVASSEFVGSAICCCQSCSLFFLWPVPSEAALERYYRTKGGVRERGLSGPAFRREIVRARSQARFLLKRVRPRAGAVVALDVGPGHGLLMGELASAGWHISGIDPDADVARATSQRLGLPVEVGSFPEGLGPEPEAFDVVIFSHSLEHFRSPIEALTSARRLLAPGGQVYVELPRASLESVRSTGHFSPHIWHFTPSALRQTLVRAQLHVAELVGTSPKVKSLRRLLLPLRHRAAGGQPTPATGGPPQRTPLLKRILRPCLNVAEALWLYPQYVYYCGTGSNPVVIVDDAQDPSVTVLRAIAGKQAQS